MHMIVTISITESKKLNLEILQNANIGSEIHFNVKSYDSHSY